MTLPSSGMTLFPVELWDGLTSEVLDPGCFVPAGPVTTRKLINEILGIENYLSTKILALPAKIDALSQPANFDSGEIQITGNAVRVTFINLVNQGESPPVVLAFSIDLNQYFPGDAQILIGTGVDWTDSSPKQTTLMYDRLLKILTYVNQTNGANGTDITCDFLLL